MRLHLIAATALLAAPVHAFAADGLQQQVVQVLAEAGPGIRWGVMVADSDGSEIVALDPEGRYVPASNTKLFTTAAALWKFTDIDQPDVAARTSAYLIRSKAKVPDVVLYGRGDARLSSARDCKIDCLSALADGIAKTARRIGNVIGDDTAFLDQRWSPGMSWNNIQTDSGTGVSALSLDDNEAIVTVSPGKDGAPPLIDGPAYFTYENRAASDSRMEMTAAAVPAPASAQGNPAPDDQPKPIEFSRMPGSKLVRIMGAIKLGSPPVKLVLGVDDPAEYTAWAFAQALRKRGVVISGKVSAKHWTERRTESLIDEPNDAAHAAALAGAMLAEDKKASATPPPLAEGLVIINKQSQNLHAELLLRRLGADSRDRSIEGGQKVVTAMLTEAGLKPQQYFFADGSGMSSYNRVAPRGVVSFLRWTQGQPWGARFKATLPIGGIDGTLSKRFKGTALEGKIMAKSGTLNATIALAGFLTTKSGKMLIFSAYANDVPEEVKATRAMDKALLLVAEAN